MIRAENRRRLTGIAARFRQRVGRPLDPQIPLYPVDPRPPPMAVDTGFDEGVEQNNPSGDAAEIDENVVFFDAFAALPADDDDVAADDDDAMSNASLSPSADANDMESTPTPPGLSAVGIGAPSASVASLGPSAGRGNSPGNADVSGAGPDDVDGAAASPVGDGASGVRPLGLPAEGAVRPLASHGGPIGSAVGDATSAAVPGDDDVPGMGPDVVDAAEAAPVCDGASGDRTLGLPAEGAVRPLAYHGGPSGLAVGDAPSAAVPGDDDVTGMGPDVVVAAITAPVCVGASGDRPVGFSTEGRIRPPALPVGPIGSVDGGDAPLPVALNISPAADGHRPTEESVGTANVGLLGANGAPTRQSTGLYPLFNGRHAGRGRRIAAVGGGGQLNG